VGAPDTDVEACISYYRDACLHGLARLVEPSAAEVNACVTRIETGTCDATITPAVAQECAWLATELGSDAGDAGASEADAASSDSSTQIADGATAGDASSDASADGPATPSVGQCG
jgi:hypothetical protein